MKDEMEFIDLPPVEGWHRATQKEDILGFVMLAVFLGIMGLTLWLV